MNKFREHFLQCEDNKCFCMFCMEKFINKDSILKTHLKLEHSVSFDANEEVDNESSRVRVNKRLKTGEQENQRKSLEAYSDRPTTSQQASNANRRDKLDLSLICMLTMDFETSEFMNRRGLVQFLKEIYQEEEIPGRNDIEKRLSNQHDRLKEKIRLCLSNVSTVSLSIDMWSLPNNKQCITCTCHFISNHQPLSAVLKTKQFEDNLSAENIKQILKEIFTSWNLSISNIICIVTGNIANIIEAVRKLGLFHLPSFEHSLTLVAIESLRLNIFSSLINRIDDIMAFFEARTESTIAMAEMKTVQEKMSELKLYPTNWINIYNKMTFIVQVKEPLRKLSECLENAPSPLSAEDTDKIHDCIIGLGIIYKACKEISRGLYVKRSLIIPIIFNIHEKLSKSEKKMKTSDGVEFFNTMKNSIKQKLKIHETNPINKMCTILDPRWKKEVFREEMTANEIEKLIFEEDSQSDCLESCSNCSATTEKYSDGESDGSNDDSFLKDLDLSLGKASVCTRRTSKHSSELSRYLQESRIRINRDPMAYWKENRLNYPNLYKKAIKFLCIPANCVSSEGIVSDNAFLMDYQRRKIKPNELDKYIFLHHNICLKDIDICVPIIKVD